MKIAVVPLDRRPPHTQFVDRLARMAGIDVLAPDEAWLGTLSEPADRARLLDFVENVPEDASALVVSLDALVYGGLIQSRQKFQEPIPVERVIRALATAKSRNPSLKVLAFLAVMRLSISVTSMLDWTAWEYVFERASQGDLAKGDPAEMNPMLQKVWRDFTAVRVRNHDISLSLIDGVSPLADVLVFAVEDNAPTGPHIVEMEEIEARAHSKGFGNVVVTNGCDEMTCVLFARALATEPMELSVCLPFGGRGDVIPRYESTPLTVGMGALADLTGFTLKPVPRERLAIAAQIGRDDDAARPLILVSPPASSQADLFVQSGEVSALDPSRFADESFEAIAEAIGNRTYFPIVFADVQFANGANAALVDELLSIGAYPRLGGYFAWNTAMNTLGTAVATARALAHGLSHAARRAMAKATVEFLFERLVDDCLYQAKARDKVVEQVAAQGIDPFNFTDVYGLAEEILWPLEDEARRRFNRYFSGKYIMGYRIADLASLRLSFPFDRTFEIRADADITLK